MSKDGSSGIDTGRQANEILISRRLVETLTKKIVALEEEKAKSEAIIAAIGDGIVVVDTHFGIIYQNQISREIVGNRIGDLCHAVFAHRDTTCEDCYVAKCLLDGTIQTVEKCYTVGGQPIHFEITVSPLRNSDGEVVAGIKVIRNITERKQTEEQLKFISNHDALTSLYNRSYFEGELVKLEKGRQFPVSIVMADVDDLKKINDRLGHAAGDVLLRQVAVLLREAFRSEDTVARVGGDEFAVLLPETGEIAVQEVVSRIRERLSSWNDVHANVLNLSIGMAVAENGVQLQEALKLADRRMYEDKLTRTGRPPRRHL